MNLKLTTAPSLLPLRTLRLKTRTADLNSLACITEIEERMGLRPSLVRRDYGITQHGELFNRYNLRSLCLGFRHRLGRYIDPRYSELKPTIGAWKCRYYDGSEILCTHLIGYIPTQNYRLRILTLAGEPITGEINPVDQTTYLRTALAYYGIEKTE